MVRLSSYKLVQYLQEYVNLEGIENAVVIYSCTAQTWLNKLGFVYKEININIFVDSHK